MTFILFILSVHTLQQSGHSFNQNEHQKAFVCWRTLPDQSRAKTSSANALYLFTLINCRRLFSESPQTVEGRCLSLFRINLLYVLSERGVHMTEFSSRGPSLTKPMRRSRACPVSRHYYTAINARVSVLAARLTADSIDFARRRSFCFSNVTSRDKGGQVLREAKFELLC